MNTRWERHNVQVIELTQSVVAVRFLYNKWRSRLSIGLPERILTTITHRNDSMDNRTKWNQG
ncbi:unnamed protein product, partial [Strongylus vulgaris]